MTKYTPVVGLRTSQAIALWPAPSYNRPNNLCSSRYGRTWRKWWESSHGCALFLCLDHFGPRRSDGQRSTSPAINRSLPWTGTPAKLPVPREGLPSMLAQNDFPEQPQSTRPVPQCSNPQCPNVRRLQRALRLLRHLALLVQAAHLDRKGA